MIVMELLITIHIITHLSVILKTITYISINNYHYQSSSAILSFQLIRAGLTDYTEKNLMCSCVDIPIIVITYFINTLPFKQLSPIFAF